MDKTEEYNVLFKVETNDLGKKYLVYTKGEKNKEGEVIAYAASYELKGGLQELYPIEDEYTLEFLDSVLLQVQTKMNKEVSE